jgi:hypothetical protein
MRRKMDPAIWPVTKFGPLYPRFNKEKMPDGSTEIFLKNHDKWRLWVKWQQPFPDGTYWSAEEIGSLRNDKAIKKAFKKKKVWSFSTCQDEISKKKSLLLKKRGYTKYAHKKKYVLIENHASQE